jgi:hypothetical protein
MRTTRLTGSSGWCGSRSSVTAGHKGQAYGGAPEATRPPLVAGQETQPQAREHYPGSPGGGGDAQVENKGYSSSLW